LLRLRLWLDRFGFDLRIFGRCGLEDFFDDGFWWLGRWLGGVGLGGSALGVPPALLKGKSVARSGMKSSTGKSSACSCDVRNAGPTKRITSSSR
jgi:hypothetical protein